MRFFSIWSQGKTPKLIAQKPVRNFEIIFIKYPSFELSVGFVPSATDAGATPPFRSAQFAALSPSVHRRPLDFRRGASLPIPPPPTIGDE